MKKLFVYTIMAVLGISLIFALWYGGFALARWFNWKFGYETKTRQMIVDMVKPEALK